jgi:hypothetical protein
VQVVPRSVIFAFVQGSVESCRYFFNQTILTTMKSFSMIQKFIAITAFLSIMLHQKDFIAQGFVAVRQMNHAILLLTDLEM